MGISRDRLVDPASIPPSLICSICLEILDNPHSVCLEDHIFCRRCCDDFFSNQDIQQHQADMSGTAFKSYDCPTCRSFQNYHRRNYRIAKFAGRLAGALVVYCENKEFGCKWSGELSNSASHLASCTRRMIDCPNHCGCEFRANKLRKHRLKECEEQMLVCPRGGAKCTFLRCEKSEHVNECEFWKCRVIEKCPTTGSLEMLAVHEPYCQEIHNSLERAQSAAGMTNLEKEFEELEAENEEYQEEVERLGEVIDTQKSTIRDLVEEVDKFREQDEDDMNREEFIENLYEVLADTAADAEASASLDGRIAIRDERIKTLEKELAELKPKPDAVETEYDLYDSVHPAYGVVTGIKRKIDQVDDSDQLVEEEGEVAVGVDVNGTGPPSHAASNGGYRFLKMIRLG